MLPALKISGITDLHDARYCAAVGIGFLGFSIDGPDAVSTEQIGQIKSWISGPEIVGEFEGELPNHIQTEFVFDLLDRISLSSAQLGSEMNQIGRPSIWRFAGLPDADMIQQLTALYTDCIFEFPLLTENQELWNAIVGSRYLNRFILVVDEPDPIWKIAEQTTSQPFAFSLRNFIKNEEGELDYDKCDAFIQQYQSLPVT